MDKDNLLGKVKEAGLNKILYSEESIMGLFVAEDIVNMKTGIIYAEAGDEISATLLAVLEENKILDIRLLTLYHQSKQYDKALKLTRTLYLKTKDVNFLAQLAILEYEMAENKADILDTVIANFTIALESIDSHTYQNYFGYILIDHDVDVKKGIKFVKKALEKEPNSIAYRDSLAWGYYKQHDCKKAKTIIEKLKDEIGLEDLEMKKHYDAIKECK